MIYQAQLGKHQYAIEATEEILAASSRSGMALLYAACCCCVSAEAARRDGNLAVADQARRAKSYLDRAMQLLRETRTTGLFRQPFQFLGLKSNDPDLAPLRGREDFKAFVAELEAEAESAVPRL